MRLVVGDLHERLATYRKLKGQALILVPETADVHWFSKKISGALPYHGGLAKGAAWKNWTAFARDEARVLVATRIGALAPARKLKTIVIERDEDPSHRNTDAEPHYDVRLIAEERAAREDVELVVGTEVPRVVRRPTHSFAVAEPLVVDLTAERRARNPTLITHALAERIAHVVRCGKKAILLMNRKGLAGAVVCRDCKHLLVCPRCEVPLTLYRHSLVCPSCKAQSVMPLFCEHCRGPEFVETRVGVQRLFADLKKMFPDVEVSLVSKMSERDKPPPYPTRAGIVVATEVVLHWYRYELFDDERIGLIAPLLADQLWGRPGYASHEIALRTLGSLGMLARRHRAEFVVQTYALDSPVINALQGRMSKFYEEELADRKTLGYPPFGHIALLRNPRQTPTIIKAETIEEIVRQARGRSIDLDPEIIPDNVSS